MADPGFPIGGASNVVVDCVCIPSATAGILILSSGSNVVTDCRVLPGDPA